MTASKSVREAFFLPGAAGDRFCLLTHAANRGADSHPVGTLVFVHPFAEEMNKSRRMVALAVRAFAEQGWATLQIDLLGCGDSAGDLSDADWAAWVTDVGDAVDWVRKHIGGRVVLWGLRSGALVVADYLKVAAAEYPLLLWQPVTNGRQHLNQFLRLKAAGDMLADADAKASMNILRTRLEAGEVVDIAGYRLPSALAGGMEAASFSLPASYRSPVALLDVGAAGREGLSPALGILQERLTKAGTPVYAQAVTGPSFWQTQEIEICSALIEASQCMLEQRL